MQRPLVRHLDRIRALTTLACERLPGMVDPATGLLVFRVSGPAGAASASPRGTSVRYSAIGALGVERAAAHGLACGLDLDRLLSALDAARPGLDDSGDLGLVLWASARRARPVAERALRDLLELGPLTRKRGGRSFHTTELAWVVLGLAEALAAGVGDDREVGGRLRAAFAELLANRGASGLFAFARDLPGSGGARAWRGRLRAELGFFDNQVYSLLAALRVYELLGDPAAREAAVTVGDRLLGHQHALGQWAWHYNVRSGALVDLYPVYAVHQDGMAPMALLPLERLTGLRTGGAVARGVDWLFGDNELGEPLVEPDRALLWRSMRRRQPLRAARYPLKLASLARTFDALDLGARLSAPRLLEIDRELRPYHLGWCLYAFAELVGAAARPGVQGPDAGASEVA